MTELTSDHMRSASIGIVTKADSAFYPGAMALIRSLEATNPQIPIVVFDAGLSAQERSAIQARGAVTLPLANRYVPRAESVQGTHYNASIFALMEFDRLPFDRILHLDADTVVLGSLAPFVSSLQDSEFLGVCDFPPLTLADNVGDRVQQELAIALFGFSEKELLSPAFNAGVFSISSSAYRRIRPLMDAAYDSPLLLPLRDQTLLNISLVAGGLRRAEPLSVHYNFRHRFRRAANVRWDGIEVHQNLLVPRFRGELVKILHFIGADKPWHQSFTEHPEALSLWRQFS